MSGGQGEAKPHAANCVELSRAKPEHFASVWLLWVWRDRGDDAEEGEAWMSHLPWK